MREEFDKNKNVDPETAVRLVTEGERKCEAQRTDLLWQCKFLKHHMCHVTRKPDFCIC